MEQVNEFTAHGYSDNFAIIRSGTGDCVGCEHNETEAKHLVAFLNGRNGGGYSIRKNPRHLVAAAKQFFPQPVRHPLRDEVFDVMRTFR